MVAQKALKQYFEKNRFVAQNMSLHEAKRFAKRT